MLRSMFAAVSGLRSHQTMMDVVGNNISNVNTAGYKASRTTFQDAMNQVIRGSSQVQDDRAGTNPMQIGLGSQVAGIDSVLGQGSIQLTGRNLDLAIQGEGFFVMDVGGTNLYSRAGAFNVDAAGTLTGPSGARVMGWLPDADGAIDTQQPLTALSLPTGQVIAPVESENVTIGGNLPADAAENDEVNTSITIYDQQGTAFSLTLTFAKTATPDEWTVTAEIDGTAVDIGETLGGAGASYTMTFDSSTGGPEDGAGDPLDALVIDLSTAANGVWDTDGLNLNLDETGAELKQFAGSTTAEARLQDGSEIGFLRGFEFGTDGTVTGRFSNGQTKILGAVAIATFNNPAGLQRQGESLFVGTLNSGQALVGRPGEGDAGVLSPGALEMSNVDMAQEFTNLIVAQRGFQANARSITASDEMLADIVNLKR